MKMKSTLLQKKKIAFPGAGKKAKVMPKVMAKPKVAKAPTDLAKTVLIQVAGEEILPLVHYLKGKVNVSEFVIAQDMKQEINIIRNLLYRLLDQNLVTFNRKKDKQKGWYIYYWTYHPQNIEHTFWELKKKKLDSLKDRLFREKNNVFFSCPTGCIRLDFETSITFDYRCPECGEILNQQDNSQKKLEFEAEIAKLEAEISTRNAKRIK